MLKIQDLTKVYRTTRKQYYIALQNVSFTIDKEKMVAITGESGGGKSTLMNLISTLDTSTKGYVELNGTKVNYSKENLKSKYRMNNIGFVFQSFNLISDITVLDNVTLVMEIAGVNKESRTKRALELLKLVGLEDHINKKPGFLSGGQKQRVAIARALANDPDIILADEPTGALDSKTSEEVMKLLKSISATGKKVIIVTHDQKVANYCERIIKLEDGQIIEDRVNEANELDTIDLPDVVEKSKKGLGLSSIFKLSSNSFSRKKKRNILISIGTAISLSSLLLINILSASLNNFFYETSKLYGNEQIILSEFVGAQTKEASNEGFDQFINSLSLKDSKVVEDSFDIPNYNLQSSIFTSTVDLDATFIPTIMYPKEYATFGTKDIVKGKAPSKINEIAIVENATKYFKLTKDTAVGSKVSLASINSLGEPSLEEFVISGLLNKDSFIVQGSTIFFTNEYAVSKGVDETNFKKTRAFIVEKGEAIPLIDVLNGEITSNAISGKYQDISGYLNVRLASATLTDLISISGVILQTFSIVLSISIIVAGIMIAVMIYISILERMKEIGVIRAVGGKKKDVRRMFYLESIGIGLISGILAIVFASACALIAIHFINQSSFSTANSIRLIYSFEIIPILITLFGAIFLSLISSILSIRLGLKVTPVNALKMK